MFKYFFVQNIISSLCEHITYSSAMSAARSVANANLHLRLVLAMAILLPRITHARISQATAQRISKCWDRSRIECNVQVQIRSPKGVFLVSLCTNLLDVTERYIFMIHLSSTIKRGEILNVGTQSLE